VTQVAGDPGTPYSLSTRPTQRQDTGGAMAPDSPCVSITSRGSLSSSRPDQSPSPAFSVRDASVTERRFDAAEAPESPCVSVASRRSASSLRPDQSPGLVASRRHSRKGEVQEPLEGLRR
jgi:hypothetical protein